MQAVTVVPGTAGSARLDDVPEPDPTMGSVVVEALAVGVCGTDAEIAGGAYGWAPPGEERLILGHESLGQGARPGPHRAGGRRPCRGHRAAAGPGAVPELRRGRVGHVLQRPATPSAASSRCTGSCPSAGGSSPSTWSGSTRASGFSGVLLEPTTVVAKAWEQILTIGQRTFWDPHTVLVVGAGPDRAAGGA